MVHVKNDDRPRVVRVELNAELVLPFTVRLDAEEGYGHYGGSSSISTRKCGHDGLAALAQAKAAATRWRSCSQQRVRTVVSQLP